MIPEVTHGPFPHPGRSLPRRCLARRRGCAAHPRLAEQRRRRTGDHERQHRHEEHQLLLHHEVRPEDETRVQGRRALPARRRKRRETSRQGNGRRARGVLVLRPHVRVRDPFKSINDFIAPVVGGGYRFIKTDTRNLSADAGLGVERESNSVLGSSSGGAAKAGENFDWTISPTSKFTQKLTGIWKTSEWSDALYHFDAGLTTTVATRVELKLAYTYDYKNRPVLATIRKGDSALFAAVLFKF